MSAKMKFKWILTMGYRGKALVIVSLIIFLLSLAFFSYGVSQHNQTIDLMINKAEEDITIAISQIHNRSFIYYEKRLLAFSEFNTDIVKAFAERDRKRLYELTLVRFNILKKENKFFRDLNFYLPDGHSFLRMHDPEELDNEQVEIRSTLQRIHEENKMISGFMVTPRGGRSVFLGLFFSGTLCRSCGVRFGYASSR